MKPEYAYFDRRGNPADESEERERFEAWLSTRKYPIWTEDKEKAFQLFRRRWVRPEPPF